MPTQVRADVYTRVTEAILAAIEAGTGNWRMPWHHSGADVTRPTNIASGKPYRGINTVSLWAAARSEEHTSELQSLMRISYAVFCLQKKTKQINSTYTLTS